MSRVDSKVCLGMAGAYLKLKTDKGKDFDFLIPTGRIPTGEIKIFAKKLIRFSKEV